MTINIFDGEVISESVEPNSARLSPDEIKLQGALAWLDEVESFSPEIGAELREKFKMFLPQNIDELGVEPYKEELIPRVNAKGEIRYVKNTFPEDCPIKPLGKGSDFGWYYFLDGSGDLVYSNIRGQQEVEALFGKNIPFLLRAWPNAKMEMKGNKVTHSCKGFYLTHVRQCLVAECDEKGKFDAKNKVRGRGGWRDDDGNFVLHLGDAVLHDGKLQECGQIGNYIYPSRVASPRPVACTAKEADDLLAIFNQWNWGRPDIDPYLLFGWMGTAILTGAITWRPMLFIDADKGSGKSTLQKYIRAILNGRIVGIDSASEAYLRSAVGQDAVAVSFDELEPDPSDPERASKIIRLARLAASGATDGKGTKDQGTKEFTLRGGMLFSAINIPKMTGADADRFGFLSLKAIPENAPEVEELTVNEGIAWGQKLAGRMLEAWPRWSKVLKAYRGYLLNLKHTPRSADQFGNLLAAADCLLYDKFDDERAKATCSMYRPERLIECQNTDPNWFRCYNHILQHQPEAWRGNYGSIGTVVAQFMRKVKRYAIDPNDKEFDVNEASGNEERERLHKAGLSIVKGHNGAVWLAIPISHRTTEKIFKNTEWPQWGHALNQAPEEIWRRQQVAMDGTRPLCVLINLDGKVQLKEGDERPMFEWKNEVEQFYDGDE